MLPTFSTGLLNFPILCGLYFNPLNAELNPICHLLALLGAHRIFHASELRVNDMCSPSDHVTLAIHADETAIIATSGKLAPLFSYLESYVGDPERWLRETTIAINVSRSAALIFTRCGRRFFSCSSTPSAGSTKHVYLGSDP